MRRLGRLLALATSLAGVASEVQPAPCAEYAAMQLLRGPGSPQSPGMPCSIHDGDAASCGKAYVSLECMRCEYDDKVGACAVRAAAHVCESLGCAHPHATPPHASATSATSAASAASAAAPASEIAGRAFDLLERAHLISAPPKPGSAPHSSPLLHSAILTATSLIALAITSIFCLGPTTRLAEENLFTPESSAADRARIARLAIPADAIRLRTAGGDTTPRAEGKGSPMTTMPPPPARASFMRRGAPAHTKSGVGVGSSVHSWTFEPSGATSECTPLLVFVNRSSGGREGQLTLARLRSLLSPHQVP